MLGGSTESRLPARAGPEKGIAGSILVLWPRLTPLGSLFNQLQAAREICPAAGVDLGYADVLGLMLAAIWFTRR